MKKRIIQFVVLVIIFLVVMQLASACSSDSVEASSNQYYSYNNEYRDNSMKIYIMKDKEYDKEHFIIINKNKYSSDAGDGAITVVERNKGSLIRSFIF